ncbi:MAG: TatD family hydrolase [Cyclobacteriaceae bacterium]|nr:TatD family hydrolase [Cyclobacteriaceae bacterium]
MKLIDTHAHIYLEEFKEDINEVIDRSKEGGIEKIYLPNIDHASIDKMMELEHKFPEYCEVMMGLHPCSVKQDFEKELYLVEDWLNKRKFIGIGEIGTDLYWDKTYWKQQQEAFKIQLDFAKQYKIPAIIHCRDSIDETIKIVTERKTEDLTGIFHCFTGTVEQAQQIFDLGFYIGVGGVSTFKNGGMDKTLPEMDINKIVLETDSPYLAPVPYRGKRNEPSYVKLVAQRVADIMKLDITEVSNITTINALKIFQQE